MKIKKTEIMQDIMAKIFDLDYAVMKFDAEDIEITTYENEKFRISIEAIETDPEKHTKIEYTEEWKRLFGELQTITKLIRELGE